MAGFDSLSDLTGDVGSRWTDRGGLGAPPEQFTAVGQIFTLKSRYDPVPDQTCVGTHWATVGGLVDDVKEMRKTIRAAMLYGVGIESIANVVGVGVNTVRRWIAEQSAPVPFIARTVIEHVHELMGRMAQATAKPPSP